MSPDHRIREHFPMCVTISSVYRATKSYDHAFTRGLQQELADTNVRVQPVLPAATATDMWEISGVPLSALDATS
jgi:uncharacterized protein